MNEIAKNIRRLRTNSGMTQEEAATQFHISRQGFSNWETGRSQPDIESLTALAELFGVDINEVIYGEKREHPGVSAADRKRHLRLCILFAVLFAVLLAAELWAAPIAREQLQRYYGSGWAFALMLGISPLKWLLLPEVPLQLASIWRDLGIRARWLRRTLWMAGAALILCYLAIMLLEFGTCVSSRFVLTTFLWFYKNPAWSLLPGALLAVGLNR